MKKLSKYLILFGAVAGCTLFASSAQASTTSIPVNTESVSIFVGNQTVQFPDAQPFIDTNSRTQVPVRFVSEELGYHVSWNMEGSAVHVTLTNGSDRIELQTNEGTAYHNGQAMQMDTQPLLYNQRTYVPLRFVAEALHSNVQWDALQHTVHISQGATVLDESKQAQPISTLNQQEQQKSQTTRPQQPQSNDQAIIDFAKKYMGTPYVFGGTGTSGFDCSGYVQYVFAHNGIQLPRTAAQMYTLGTKVSDLKPGDLVFFTTYQAGASHVGIYLGNQQFISATSSHGVSISTLDNPYWGPRYLGAKRL